jgi:hypothetical protein
VPSDSCGRVKDERDQVSAQQEREADRRHTEREWLVGTAIAFASVPASILVGVVAPH